MQKRIKCFAPLRMIVLGKPKSNGENRDKRGVSNEDTILEEREKCDTRLMFV